MLIDSHCHLPANPTLIKEILGRAKDNQVNYVVNIGTELCAIPKVIKSTQHFEEVFGVVGIYPNSDRKLALPKIMQKLEDQLKTADPKIVGIGECGIDITEWKQQRPINEQIELFEAQIELAIKNNLPIVIHNRNGDEQVLNSLNKYRGQVKGIAHCFDTSYETAKKLLDLGLYISFSGFITYNSKKYLLETVENVPLDRFLIETDSPYIVPKGLKDQQNESKNVKMIAKKVAEVKKLDFEQVCTASFENTVKVFNLKING